MCAPVFITTCKESNEVVRSIEIIQKNHFFTVTIIVWKSFKEKRFKLDFWASIDFHMVVLAVVDNILTLCSTGTAMCVPVLVSAFIKYRGCRKVIDKGTRI